MPNPTADAPDVSPVPKPERERFAASERLLSSLDYMDRSSSLSPKSSTTGAYDSRTTTTESGEKTSLTFTPIGGGDRPHSIEYTKGPGGELKEITVGGTKWMPDTEKGGWKARGSKGENLHTDRIDVTGERKDTRVTFTGKGGDLIVAVGADGSQTTTVRGPNGSEHAVTRDRKDKITEVSHNGHKFTVGADGKTVTGPGMRGATIDRDGNVTKKFGDSTVTMRPDGSTEVKTGNRTTVGYGDGSRVYKENGAIVGARDTEGRNIMVDKTGKATVTKGGKVVPHELNGKTVSFDSTKNPPVMTTTDNPSKHHHLDGRSTTFEKKDGVTRPKEMTDAKGRKLELEYGDSANKTKVTGFKGTGYGSVGREHVKDIKVDHEKGRVTAKMVDGTTSSLDMSKRTSTLGLSDGSTKTRHLDHAVTEVRSRDGSLSVEYDSGRKWNVTEKNGKITEAKSGGSHFKVDSQGVKDIKFKDGEIRVAKDDGTVHRFKNNEGKTNLPARDGQPARTVTTMYDREGRLTGVNDGSTANGGKGATYTIERDRSGNITGVKGHDGKPITAADGKSAKGFSVDDKGRITGKREGGGTVVIDPERATKTTETNGMRTVESPTAKVEYKKNDTGKATEAKIYAAGAKDPTFTAKLGPDGKTVTELRDARTGELTGKSRPGSHMTMDDAGRIKTVNRNGTGGVRSEVTLHPDKSRTVREAGRISELTPDGRLSSVRKSGMPEAASFKYHSEGGKVAKIAGPRGAGELSVPSEVKFGDGCKVERMAGGDASSQKPGDPKFVLTGPDGRAVMELKAAGVDKDGVTHVKDDKGRWHKIGPEGPLASVRDISGGAPGPADKRPNPGGRRPDLGGGTGGDRLRPGAPDPFRPALPGSGREGGPHRGSGHEGGRRLPEPGGFRPPERVAPGRDGKPGGDAVRPGSDIPGTPGHGHAKRPWSKADEAGTKALAGAPHILTKVESTKGGNTVRTYLDTRHNVKTEVERHRGVGMKFSETKVDAKTGEVSKETYSRLPPGTPLEHPPGRVAGPRTFVSDKTETRVVDGTRREVPKYRDFNLDLAGPHKRRTSHKV